MGQPVMVGGGAGRGPCGCSGSGRSWKPGAQLVPALEVPAAARMALPGLLGSGSAAAPQSKSFDLHESERVTQKHPVSTNARH